MPTITRCDNCGDDIFGKRIKVEEPYNRKFTFDIGCSLLLEERGLVEIKGQKYNLMYK